MYQHALIVCLKWISGVSLPFRPSSGAPSHSNWVTTTLVAARGQRAGITQWRLKWKEQPSNGWHGPKRQRSCEQPCFKSPLLAAHPGAAGRQSPSPSASPPPLSRPAPQRLALIYNYHPSLDIPLNKRGRLLHEGINGWMITFLIKLKESLQQ